MCSINVVIGFWTLRVDFSVFYLLLRTLIVLAALEYVSLNIAVLLCVYGCPLYCRTLPHIHTISLSTALHCLKAFDVTRKATYQHLDEWSRELRNFCQDIPVILVANKIDVNYKVSEER